MTYNFDPERWYDNESAVLAAARRAGRLTASQHAQSMDALQQRYEDMVVRLDGTYQLPADPHRTAGGPFEVQVGCYAGYRGEETPRRFRLGTRRIAVRDLLDRWLAPDHRYFKVLGDDGGTYILRHDPVNDRWEVTFFRQTTAAPDVWGGPYHEPMA